MSARLPPHAIARSGGEGITQKWRLAWALALLLVVNIAVTSLVQQAEATTYRQGSSGEQVWIIQTKLKNWGYYDGVVDGIYGSQTVQAVKYLQRKNGLTADGIAGPATLRVLGMSSGGRGNSNQQNSTALLARVISTEAQGEPCSDQVAVGAMILNRVEHPSFPSTIVGVVYQPGAFTYMVDGQSNEPVADSAYQAAQDVLDGADLSDGTTYYFNLDAATSAWIWSRPLIRTIGKYRFCA